MNTKNPTQAQNGGQDHGCLDSLEVACRSAFAVLYCKACTIAGHP
uniref:Uncharacterized protein n=1 Tax=Anguilla anguilla TaxID=7936 RepID=A0A0E9U0N2_ANGAN